MVRQVAKQAAAAPLVTALLAACLSSGCFMLAPAPYTIRLASADERLPKPRFVITQRSRPEAPRFYLIDLWDRATGIRTWRALSNSLAARPTLLVYGELEGEWDVQSGPTALEEGKRYILDITGEGDGNIRFRVQADGLLVEEE
jgi:hypothetical protein